MQFIRRLFGARLKPDFSRNLGLIRREDQERLLASRVTVAGIGTMGGVAAEALVRMGIGGLTILDNDTYEVTNINRQLHCTLNVIGKRKVDVVARKLRQINPDLKLRVSGHLNKDNVDSAVIDSEILINGMDEVRPSILLERRARALGKTIVDAWITPYASVFVMKPNSPHWEEFLDFPTRNKSWEEISDADVKECLRKEIAFTLKQFEPFKIIDRQTVENILAGKIPRPSMVPVGWLSGVLMANETLKILIGQGRIASHWGVFYNQIDHKMLYLEGDYCNAIASDQAVAA